MKNTNQGSSRRCGTEVAFSTQKLVKQLKDKVANKREPNEVSDKVKDTNSYICYSIFGNWVILVMNLLQDFNSGGAGAAGHSVTGFVNATPTFGSMPFGECVVFYP